MGNPANIIDNTWSWNCVGPGGGDGGVFLFDWRAGTEERKHSANCRGSNNLSQLVTRTFLSHLCMVSKSTVYSHFHICYLFFNVRTTVILYFIKFSYFLVMSTRFSSCNIKFFMSTWFSFSFVYYFFNVYVVRTPCSDNICVIIYIFCV